MRLESVAHEAYAARREARIAADASLPRVRLVSGYRGDRSHDVVVVRRTASSVWVRSPGEAHESRYVRSGEGADWMRHGNKAYRSYGDEPRIPAADIAALGEVSDE